MVNDLLLQLPPERRTFGPTVYLNALEDLERVHKSKHPGGGFAILMEDLSFAGYTRVPETDDTLDAAHYAGFIEALGGMHGTAFLF